MLRLYNSGANSNPNFRIENDVQHYTIQTVGARNDNFEIADTTAGSGAAQVRLSIQSATGNVLIGTTTTVADSGILTLSKGITFPATQVASANANTLDDYREATFTATLTGTTTSPTGVVSVVKSGSMITMEIPSIVGTSNTTAATLTGVPSLYRPTTNRRMFFVVHNNSVKVLGMAYIKSDGVIEIYAGLSETAFTASGSKGAIQCSLSYII